MERIQLTEPEVSHFAAYCLARGGKINNTGFRGWEPKWPSYCNPSIFYDKKDDKFRMIQRNVSYVLNGSKGKLWGAWGPLHYSIPQDRGRYLETRNFMCVYNNELEEFQYQLINMRKRTPMWEFVGLEDARCVRWNGKLYAIGVRRDDNTTGRGRMELCELNDNFEEVSSVKLKAPDGDTQYCIKNWMPVTDQPYWFIHQAANPTILVGMNPETGEVASIIKKEQNEVYFEGFDMPRGSSHCIPWKDGHHLCIIHTCQMYYTGNKRKFARYLHAFIEYDKDWNIYKVSPMFSFDDLVVEFCCGLTMKDDEVYISFALQDNCSYVLQINAEVIDKFVSGCDLDIPETNTVWDKEPKQSELFNYAMTLYNNGDNSGAFTWLTKAIDLYPYTYNERFMAARSVANLGHRDNTEIGLWMDCIEHDPTRPEAYCAAANYYLCRGGYMEAYQWIVKAMEKMVTKQPNIWYSVDDIRKTYKIVASQTSHYNEVDSTLKAVKAF